MQCCNNKRYTFGIIIGSIYTLASLIIFSVSVFSYFDGHHGRATSEVISAALVTALISALFIFAIVRRQHNLILPWLFLCVTIFIGTGFFILIVFLGLVWENVTNDVYFIYLLITVLVIGIEIGVFWFSSGLYRDLRKYNIERVADVGVTYKNGTDNYIRVP